MGIGMGVYLNPGNEGFREAINSEIYVDKTELITHTNKLISTSQKYVCVSRPRRFGKSMAANMLVAYYGKGCDSAELFDGYKLARHESYHRNLNQYNVIKLNMQDFLYGATTIDDMLMSIQREVLFDLRKAYSSCSIENIQQLSMALQRIYAETNEKFIFVIDEWDCLMRMKTTMQNDPKPYLDFIRNLLKDKEYVALAYMTGILPIKKYGEHSALNMFSEYSMTDQGRLAEYTGFTEPEVETLCRQYDVDISNMKAWYDGYYMKNVGHIYSPRSVVEAITRGSFGNYWTQTETYEALKSYIEMNYDGLKDAVIAMLSDAKVIVSTRKFQNDMLNFTSKDDVMTLLVHLGYLTYDSEMSEVYIPNYEIRGEFANAVEGAKWTEVMNSIQRSEKLL